MDNEQMPVIAMQEAIPFHATMTPVCKGIASQAVQARNDDRYFQFFS